MKVKKNTKVILKRLKKHQTTKGRGGEGWGGEKVSLITTSQRSWDVVKK
jgi:hypothetical protein